MAFADQVLALTTMLAIDRKRFISSVSLTHDFLASAAKGEWICGSAELLTQTGSLAFARGLLRTPRRCVLRCSGVYRVGSDDSPAFDLAAILDQCERSAREKHRHTEKPREEIRP